MYGIHLSDAYSYGYHARFGSTIPPQTSAERNPEKPNPSGTAGTCSPGAQRDNIEDNNIGRAQALQWHASTTNR